ncbi:hypothetical protein [Aeoliella sp. SH292]|uniref:hypothetical protein n=1 Tax=Aeoliella sp. SH292 TaxID=3454464 RepID=UPI003F962887
MTNELKTEPKKKEKEDGSKKPEHVIRDGGIAAMIWRRESTTGFPYYEYSISRSWKNQAGRAGYSQNYFSRNEAQLINVIGQATKWIADVEAKDQAGQPGVLAA